MQREQVQKWARGCWISDKAEGIRYRRAPRVDVTMMKDEAKKQARWVFERL